jgi:hypothetical protein
MALCEAAQGSQSSCECILAKQELSPVVKGRAFAEMLVLEAAAQERLTLADLLRHPKELPVLLRRNVAQCVSTKT